MYPMDAPQTTFLLYAPLFQTQAVKQKACHDLSCPLFENLPAVPICDFEQETRVRLGALDI
jgi:hypothetical protein